MLQYLLESVLLTKGLTAIGNNNIHAEELEGTKWDIKIIFIKEFIKEHIICLQLSMFNANIG